MKLIFAGLLVASTLAIAAPASAHHHRHMVCFWHHHHRVCHWAW